MIDRAQVEQKLKEEKRFKITLYFDTSCPSSEGISLVVSSKTVGFAGALVKRDQLFCLV